MSYRSVYAVIAGIWLSGVSWLIFHYFFLQQTEFGPTHHPMEHLSLLVHGAFAFLSLWLMGFLWATHVSARWRRPRHRKTGISVFVVMLLLIITGYLLYYVSNDDWRAMTSTAHWVIGLALPIVFLSHWWIRARR